jgi:hypothetical protein
MRELVERLGGLFEDNSATGYDLFTAKLTWLVDNPTWQNAKEFRSWAMENYAIGSSPRGQKDTSQQLEKVMENAKTVGAGIAPGGYGYLLTIWSRVDKDVFNKFFTNGGDSAKSLVYIGKYATYRNMAGLSDKRLKEIANRLDEVFGAIKGWRKKALNKLVVGLAGPAFFKSKAGGRYGIADDILYVRATPDVLKRSAGSYGSPEYIIIHELGHRYEKLYGFFEMWGSVVNWATTRYSFESEREAMAELFALGHFDIKSVNGKAWNPLIQEKFEKRMQTGKDNP